MKTLALTDDWELSLTASGNLAMLTGDASAAQSVANAQRCHTNEAYYNMPRGIPYFAEVEGHMPPERLITAHLERVALTVPDVIAAKTTITDIERRAVHGKTVSETVNGGTIYASF